MLLWVGYVRALAKAMDAVGKRMYLFQVMTNDTSARSISDQILGTLSVSVFAAHRSSLGREWGTPPSVGDPFSRLYVIEAGSGSAEHDGRRYQLRPNHMYIIPAHRPVRLSCEDRIVIQWVHFGAHVLGGLDFFRCFIGDYEVGLDNPKHSLRLLTHLRRYYGSELPEEPLMVRGLMFELLSKYLPTVKASSQVIQRSLRFEPILRHIDENLDQTLRIAELADMIELGPSHFAAAFRSCFGCTPAHFVQRRRVERAQHYLVDSGMTLEEIAAQVGFCDAYHLSKVFKKLVGISPSAFRRRAGALQP